MTQAAVLTIDRLSLGLRRGSALVKDVSLHIGQGEIVGVVGESGSGKTLIGRSVVNLLPAGIEKTAGEVHVCGKHIFKLSPYELRRLRGHHVGMVFQDPMISLNPSMTIGRQLEEVLRLHGSLSGRCRHMSVIDILAQVEIPEPERAFHAWPHQFSGGQRQRIMIASAMLLKPPLIIADEPTTALDAIIQRAIMELLVRLAQEHKSAIMLISHDLPMMAHFCHRLYIMERGQIIEAGETAALINQPQTDYTKTLLAAIPQARFRPEKKTGAAVMRTHKLKVDYATGLSLFGRKKTHTALHEADIEIGSGEIVALVGQSGSGKTTLGKAIAGLIPISGGGIEFDAVSVDVNHNMTGKQRCHCQFIFQDPHSSLDPRMTVYQILAQPLRHQRLDKLTREQRILSMLEDVGLGDDYQSRLPHQLSGGQKQRVAIARALIGRPALLVADEAVSALDVTIRAQILKLFTELQDKYGFSCLFVSHDLGVAEEIADRVIVMRAGQIVEQGRVRDVFERPQSDYTRQLLRALPILRHSEQGVKLGWRLL